MTITAPAIRDAHGRALPLGQLLGRGGEARVFALQDDPSRAVKLYTHPSDERARKLAAMLAKVPNDPDRRTGHVSIAWPESLILGSSGEVIGFVMPRVDTRRYLPLHQLYHPRSRRTRAPGISWRFLVRIARNLSGTLAALHEAGYLVGDLNESNILVDDRALVTLVDLDSIQVASGTRLFRCTVGKGEYTPPELQGRSFREVTRRSSSDRFGLAVLTFLLLMEGHHPFSGVYSGSGEPPSLEENILSRRSPYFGRSPLRPPPAAPAAEILGPRLNAFLRRALLAPPWRRPDARAFQEVLQRLEQDLETCNHSPTHAYRRALGNCPWCRRAARLGYDPYPADGTPSRPEPPAPTPPNPVRAPEQPRAAGAGPAAGRTGGRTSGRVTGGATVQTSARGTARKTRPATGPNVSAAVRTPGFRGSWLQFHRQLPLLSLVLLTLLATPTLVWEAELRQWLSRLGALHGTQTALLLAIALAPPAIAAVAGYLRARVNLSFARALFVTERILRAAVTASLLSLVASLAAGLTIGRGSVLAGDWLLLPSFWVVAFVVLLRVVGPRRP